MLRNCFSGLVGFRKLRLRPCALLLMCEKASKESREAEMKYEATPQKRSLEPDVNVI